MRPEPLHSPQSFGSPDLPFIHPKMMRDFVPQLLLYQSLEIFAVPSDPFVRPLKNRDAIKQMETLRNAAVSQRTSFIQTEQSSPRRVAGWFELRRRGLILD